jgi:hypothetical protein
MSKLLEDEFVVYHKFQKIFNSFDIFLKRSLVSYFMSELGEGHTSLKYFNDENNKNLCDRTVNPDYNNATQIILNDNFFNMKYDKRFNEFMSKVIEKYSV